MIYKSEFIISEDEKQYNLPYFMEHRKRDALQEVPEFLIRDIGFEEVLPNRFKMEFMVFSRKEWLGFKDTLKNYIEASGKAGLSTFNLIVVGKMITQLETKEKLPTKPFITSPENCEAVKDEEYDLQDAVIFGEWILNNGYETTQWLGKRYYTKGDGITNYKTAAQLYKIFKNTIT